ncbi:delta-9 fatty-acid desaturase DesC4 [Synechococcus sp. PROS-7-1]|uniref:acyl-CoA desaturase n=1 Tax=Synechococcus sp. PROS-7-1 TaxID=1442556 RepID=UPI000CA35B8E|nr:fatty acid desaturase [Synechococcus sp. PROS-7-1]ATV95826.1 delta-9 fatty acid desaturase [Synechococcus sp. PROS-7-1]QNI86537.1 delta-9 fatty-acid desaturase DesC4 [Synechococcus sp. PROS-7-1]
MASSVITAPSPPSRPAASHRAQALATLLQQPRRGKTSAAPKKGLHWLTIGFMIVIHSLALLALLPMFWSWQAVTSLLVLYWVTACLGVTIGYHRLLSHRSFQLPRWLERFFATCGALSCQHGPIDWVGLHRHHHKFSDTDADHHNSHRGFWWSHMGWMFESVPAMKAVPRMTGDLAQDPYYRWLNNNFLLLQLPLAGLLFWIGTATGAGGWALVLWGIPLRLALVYHVTWLVNSATHCWGTVAYDSGDASRNNKWVAALTFGEGWHNNHHAYPHSARHGLQPGQIDLTWEHIRLMRALGLATKIRLPVAS